MQYCNDYSFKSSIESVLLGVNYQQCNVTCLVHIMTEKLVNLALNFCGYSLQIIISRKILENGAVILTYADVNFFYDQLSLKSPLYGMSIKF